MPCKTTTSTTPVFSISSPSYLLARAVRASWNVSYCCIFASHNTNPKHLYEEVAYKPVSNEPVGELLMDRKTELITELERMDDTDANIVLILYVTGKLRFNELYRILGDNGVETSRPVFAEHLKRLTKMKWVIRKKKAVQNVTYELSEDKAKVFEISPRQTGEMLEAIKSTSKKPPLRIMKPEEFEKVVSPSEQIRDLVNVFLEELIAEIQYKIRYPNQSKIGDYLWFRKSSTRMDKDEIIEKCVKNLDLRLKFIEAIKSKISEENTN